MTPARAGRTAADGRPVVAEKGAGRSGGRPHGGEWAAVRVSRRQLLALGMGLGISACGPVRGHIPAPAGPPFPVLIPGATREQLASFAAFVPGLAPTATAPRPAGGGAAGGPEAVWEITSALAFDPVDPNGFTGLDAALRGVNFDATMLVPGAFAAMGAGATRADHYGVPTFVVPTGVVYNVDVFRTVGLGDPSPDWTIDDFETCCARIAAAMARGRLPNTKAVLPAVLGPPTLQVNAAGQFLFGTFIDPQLWEAFVLGFGGSVWAGDHFDLTNSGAITALQWIVDLSRRYDPGGSPSAISFNVAALYFPGGAATAENNLGPHLRWARFPRLPVRPIIPTSVGGVTVMQVGQSGSHYPPPRAPVQALDAVAQYALWWYRWTRANLAVGTLPPPALADAAVQREYWSAASRATSDYRLVGDWQNFMVVGADGRWPGYGPTSEPYATMYRAAQTGTPMAKLVADMTRKLNGPT